MKIPLQENRSLATKPFRRTKVSISSLDVPGDEIVHQATKIISSTNVGSRKVLATKYFCRLIVSTFSDECFRRLLISSPKYYLVTNLFLSPKVDLATKHNSLPKVDLATKHNSSPKVDLATKHNLSPKVDLATEHNSSPKNLQVTKLSFVAK